MRMRLPTVIVLSEPRVVAPMRFPSATSSFPLAHDKPPGVAATDWLGGPDWAVKLGWPRTAQADWPFRKSAAETRAADARRAAKYLIDKDISGVEKDSV